MFFIGINVNNTFRKWVNSTILPNKTKIVIIMMGVAFQKWALVVEYDEDWRWIYEECFLFFVPYTPFLSKWNYSTFTEYLLLILTLTTNQNNPVLERGGTGIRFV